MHFGRVLPEDWDARLKQAKAMGLSTVSLYLFWTYFLAPNLFLLIKNP
jgi:beta-galactosidase GanA